MSDEPVSPAPPRFALVRAICFGYMATLLTMTTFFLGLPLLVFGPRRARGPWWGTRL